jgi:hypothetical protein
MSTTVASRVLRSIPHRTATQTWNFIVEMLTRGESGPAALQELNSVAGIASSLITDQVLRAAAMVVTCDGPRTRVYCLYDDEALGDSDAKEDALNFDPLKGAWAISLPCAEEDLDWVQRALKGKSSRITARDAKHMLGEESEKAASASTGSMSVDMEGFLKS